MTADDLNECGVIDRFCAFLEGDGWSLLQRRDPAEKGIDVVARRGGQLLYAEAKGAVGMKSGLRINAYQGACSALMQTCAIRNLDVDARVAMVLPDTDFYRYHVATISGPLSASRIEPWLVGINGDVCRAENVVEPLQWPLKTLPAFPEIDEV
jgi:hypothetical protein